MRYLLNNWTRKSALFLGISLAAATGVAAAQATSTGTAGAELTPFIESTLLSPDWGPTNNIGYTAGIDYNRFLRNSLIQPGLELRFSSANGSTVGEKSFSGGIKVGTMIHGVRPYITLLAGSGSIAYMYTNHPAYNTSSFIYSIGGGAEFRILPSWKVRLDMVQQNWNLDPQILNPVAICVGVSYRIPFRGSGGVR